MVKHWKMRHTGFRFTQIQLINVGLVIFFSDLKRLTLYMYITRLITK